MKLENKVAIVTGAGSGIGRATAELFAKEGAKVVLADINEERLQAVQKEIQDVGGSAEFIRTDVSVLEDNKKMFQKAIDAFGKYDILFANAGIMDNMSPIGRVTDELWDRVFNINVKGPMMQIREAVNYFEANNGGSIVVTASSATLGGGFAGIAYTASKHAIAGVIENTAVAYAKKNIRINAVAPGAVETNIADTMKNLDPEGGQLFSGLSAVMPRAGKPIELAQAALFLASDDASFVNGAILPVDGGWTAY